MFYAEVKKEKKNIYIYLWKQTLWSNEKQLLNSVIAKYRDLYWIRKATELDGATCENMITMETSHFLKHLTAAIYLLFMQVFTLSGVLQTERQDWTINKQYNI